MKKQLQFLVTTVLFIVLGHHTIFGQKTIVEKYGQLSVKNKYIMSQYGDTVQLRGMSLFWSQWMGQYYDAETVKWLKDDWKCTVVRAAMGIEMGGYLENPATEKEKVIKVVDAAIAQGIYVIIDYHSHEAHKNQEIAKRFFAEMAEKYGKYPNVLYEIYNEPLQTPSWTNDLKPYSEYVIAGIRKYDPDNIVICGTRQWSQMVSEAAADPIKDANTAYTLHFYAGTHKDWLRGEAQKALDKNIALFVTEYGTCDASGNSNMDLAETTTWFNFLDANKISYCNWSIADKVETAAALLPGASGKGGWKLTEITPSGKFVRDDMILKNSPIFKTLKK